MIDLSEPRVLFDQGHTLSLIKFRNEFYGYLGHVDFSRVEIFKGENIYGMKKVGELQNARWGSAVVISKGVRLFFTRQNFVSKLPFVNPYLSQTIYQADSVDGLHFGSPRRFEEASAPFAFRDNGRLAVACHKRDPHRIWVITPECPLELLIFGKHTVSAPSVAFFHNRYWLTCEHRNGGKWNTLLYSGANLLKLKIVTTRFLSNAACAFQHLFGDRYVLTYSEPYEEGWRVMVREGEL